MTNRWNHYFGALFFLLLVFIVAPLSAFSQVVDLQLNIEPRISAQTERPLNFGTVTTGTVNTVVALGDAGMGIFSITGLKLHQIAVSLNIPAYLYHQDPTVSTRIPANIKANYGFSRNQPRNSYAITEAITSLNIPETDVTTPWGKLYIFMYGALEIGDIPEGNYSNDILLHVEYL